MELPGAKLPQPAADVRHALVGNFVALLPRIVVADINRGAFLDVAAMDGDDLVFQDGRIVIKVALENRAFGDLDESRGYFNAAERFDLRILAVIAGERRA